MTEPAVPTPLTVSAAKGLCPQCAARTLFVSPVRFAKSCSNCGLDFDAYNVGDGPAAFLTMIIGGIVLGLALWLEFAGHPPLIVHLLIWPALTIAGVIGALRVAKGMLITLEYRNKAREGVLTKLDTKPPKGGEGE
jgi:uncharacterized protein (DUF983 family)